MRSHSKRFRSRNNWGRKHFEQQEKNPSKYSRNTERENRKGSQSEKKKEFPTKISLKKSLCSRSPATHHSKPLPKRITELNPTTRQPPHSHSRPHHQPRLIKPRSPLTPHHNRKPAKSSLLKLTAKQESLPSSL